MRALSIGLLMAGLLAGASPAFAHRTSDAFVTLNVTSATLAGSWEIALRDLDVAEDLDANRDRALTWRELRGARERIAADLLNRITVGDGQAVCELRIDDLLIDDRIEGRFAHFVLSGRCSAPPRALAVGYRFLFDVDSSHRGILVLNAGGATRTAVFSPDRSRLDLELADPPRAEQFRDFAREGIHHIWIGGDHVLFLISLLLPCVLVRARNQWAGVERLAPALRQVLGVVTAFTLAHSITLTLAALDFVRIPARWSESAIALTVLLAALNNVWPVVTSSRWVVAFGFGLIHGFGFASVLGELDLPADARLLAILAFNVGVEIGQLAIVAIAAPAAFAIRNTANYRRALVPAGSLAVAAVAALWLVQRIGGVR